MIKPGALMMGVVMASVATATYYGLDLLPPGLIPPPFGRAVAPGSADSAQAAPPQIAAAAPVQPAPAAEPPADATPEEAPTEQDLAEEPAPEPAAAPAPAPAQAATPPPAPPAEPVAAAPVEKPAPTPKVEPKQAPAPTRTPAPTQTAKAESAAPPSAPKPPEADVIKPWWPDPSRMPANQLKLQYAGQVQGQQAIALLFTSALKLDTVKQHATVRSAKGEPVTGEWTLGKNPKLAVFEGLEPGRYTVILQPQISDQQGYMLGATLKGPVYVKP